MNDNRAKQRSKNKQYLSIHQISDIYLRFITPILFIVSYNRDDTGSCLIQLAAFSFGWWLFFRRKEHDKKINENSNP